MKKLLVYLMLVVAAAKINSAPVYYHGAYDGDGTRAQGLDWVHPHCGDTIDTVLVTAIASTDVYYLKTGVFTFTGGANFSSRDGLTTGSIKVIGVKSSTTNIGASITSSDWIVNHDTANMPHINLIGMTWQCGDYYQFYNLFFIGDSLQILNVAGIGCYFENCVFHQTGSAAANRACVYANSGKATFENCLFLSDNAAGIRMGSNWVLNVYNSKFDGIDNATYGYCIITGTNYLRVIDNEFKNFKYGINIASNDIIDIFNNQFYKGDTAVISTDGNNVFCKNNIIDSTKVGFKWSTSGIDDNKFKCNHQGRNVIDMYVGIDESATSQDYELITDPPIYKNEPDSLIQTNVSGGYQKAKGLGIW